MTAYYFAFLVIIFGSYIVHEVEHELNPDHFPSLGSALWWSLITFTTIGYGDKVPKSTAGKIIGGVFALLGCAVLALPAGIIATGLGLQVKENERMKKVVQRRNPAANLVICRWRCYKNGDFEPIELNNRISNLSRLSHNGRPSLPMPMHPGFGILNRKFDYR